MAFPALLIANKLITRGIDDQNQLTHLKLQKALYLAQGFYLARTSDPLIFEHFEAWRLGPVVRVVYNEYKDFGGQDINRLTPVSFPIEVNSDENAKWALTSAWNIAKSMGALTLSNWTHANDSPWDKTIKSSNDFIDNDELKEYFKKIFKL